MNAPLKELDIRAAIEYSQERRAERAQKWALETAKEFADLLISGYRGGTLEKLLHESFAATPRGVVYTAIGIAMTWHQSSLALAQLEARLLRAKLAEAGIDA